MSIILGGYQERAKVKLFDLAEKHKTHMQVAPTGAGKTVIAAAALEDIQKMGKRALFLVDGTELMHQAYTTFKKSFGLGCGFFDASRAGMPNTSIVVAMIQTLNSRVKKRNNLNITNQLKTFDYIFIDEAHILTAIPLIEGEYFKGSIIGLTATPVCAGKKPLSTWYETMSEVTTTRNLVDEGYLVNLIYRYDKDDMSDIKRRGSDYSEKKVFEEMKKRGKVSNLVPLIQQTQQKYGHFFEREKLKGIAFANKTEYVKELRDLMRANGISADYVLSDTKYQTDSERRNVVSLFKSNATDWIDNITIFTKGFDDKGTIIVVKLFKTTSITKNFQVDGRVVRSTVEGLHTMKSKEQRLEAIAKSSKPFGIVMDLGGNYKIHGRFDAERDWLTYFKGQDKYTGTGQAPTKQCPKCESFIHASLPMCTEEMPSRTASGIILLSCGYVFPKKELKDRVIELQDDESFMSFTEVAVPLVERPVKEIYDILSRKRGYELETIFLKRHSWKDDFKFRLSKLEEKARIPYLNKLVLSKVLSDEQGIELVRRMLERQAMSKAIARSAKGLNFARVKKTELEKIARIIQGCTDSTTFQRYCSAYRTYMAKV
mgnify:CR=1 FL=1